MEPGFQKPSCWEPRSGPSAGLSGFFNRDRSCENSVTQGRCRREGHARQVRGGPCKRWAGRLCHPNAESTPTTLKSVCRGPPGGSPSSLCHRLPPHLSRGVTLIAPYFAHCHVGETTPREGHAQHWAAHTWAAGLGQPCAVCTPGRAQSTGRQECGAGPGWSLDTRGGRGGRHVGPGAPRKHSGVSKPHRMYLT